ncbi:hypothetical protein BDV93DRAFT_326660 [Ceratobasidium sp. AG-I]|nr:hypothetical protein BDV93DRAFT_326660 [Ceratobasidium sp. AG-I]
MAILAGKYIIQSTRSDLVFDWANYRNIEGHGPHRGGNQQRFVKRSGRGYAIKSAICDIFIGINDGGRGNKLGVTCEHDATIWNIEHQHDDQYIVSPLGTQMYLTLPEQRGDSINLTERRTAQEVWRFERISHELDGTHQPQESVPFSARPSSTLDRHGTSMIVSHDPNSPYVDDAHFHTDMLFNLPRIPFTRMQRAVVLEWARKIGAPNVPTLESLDECERRIEGTQAGVLGSSGSESNCARETKITLLGVIMLLQEDLAEIRQNQAGYSGRAYNR